MMMKRKHTSKDELYEEITSSCTTFISTFLSKLKSGKGKRYTHTMQDEYGDMDASGETYVIKSFKLESGKVLKNVEIRYRTYGDLNETRDNCVVVCHALTGNASVHSWWKEIFGSGKLLDPSRTFIVCANVLGSCYGTTGPTSIDPKTKRLYGTSFPDVTIRDTVRSQILLVKEELGIRQGCDWRLNGWNADSGVGCSVL